MKIELTDQEVKDLVWAVVSAVQNAKEMLPIYERASDADSISRTTAEIERLTDVLGRLRRA